MGTGTTDGLIKRRSRWSVFQPQALQLGVAKRQRSQQDQALRNHFAFCYSTVQDTGSVLPPPAIDVTRPLKRSKPSYWRKGDLARSDVKLRAPEVAAPDGLQPIFLLFPA